MNVLDILPALQHEAAERLRRLFTIPRRERPGDSIAQIGIVTAKKNSGDRMTLSDFATFSTAISGFAVTASLIYLALQTHQNAKHTKALIQQGRTARLTDLHIRFGEPSMVAAIIAGNGGTPSPEAVSRQQFQAYCRALFVSLEDSFVQRGDGLLSQDQFESFRVGAVQVMSQTGVRDYWKATRTGRGGSEFAKFVDDIISKTSTVSFEAAFK
jgi:hypothetical protein